MKSGLLSTLECLLESFVQDLSNVECMNGLTLVLLIMVILSHLDWTFVVLICVSSFSDMVIPHSFLFSLNVILYFRWRLTLMRAKFLQVVTTVFAVITAQQV